MYGIEAERSGAGMVLRVWGEFDAFSLPGLRAALDDACALGGPVVADLSGVVFLDLPSARELVVRSMIQGHQLCFENPSPGVLASVRALGLARRPDDGPDREEPQVFSEA